MATIEKWLGRVSNADLHDLPPGAMAVQDNLQCLQPGMLSVRKGITKDTNYTPSSPGAYQLLSLYGYPVPDTDWMIALDANGVVKARRSSGTAVTLKTGLSSFWPLSCEKSRSGDCIGTNGMDRGFVWNGLKGNTSPYKLGIDPPAAAPTLTYPGSGGSLSSGDYTCGYRYVDDNWPVEKYSSLSATDTTIGVVADDIAEWDITASTQTRVTLVEFWRSLANAGNQLFRAARIGNNGVITSTGNNGGNVQYTTTTTHNLVVGATVTTSGTDQDVTDAEITAVNAGNKTFTVDVASTDTGNADGTWSLTGYNEDSTSDTTLADNAEVNPDLTMPILDGHKHPAARRHGVPPKWKAVCKAFQDRAWYGVDVVYDTGTLTTDGTTALVGSGTAWTTDMDGRYVWIDGESEPLKISSVGSATSITLESAASTSSAGLSYAIRSDPKEWNKLIYSEVDLFESVAASGPAATPDTIVNTVTVQENTDDDDTIQGLLPFGSVLFVLKERHIYILTFARQPNIDANVRMIAQRGAFNQRCYAMHESKAYLMDEGGAYVLTMDGNITPISPPIQDIFRDDLDYTKRKWFHVACDPQHELVYFFVVRSGDTYPNDALVYNMRTSSWWTESYFDSITDSAVGISTGAINVFLSGDDDRVYHLNSGNETDFVTSETSGTATGGSTTTIVDSSDPFDTGMIGAPVAIVAGTNKGEVRTITGATASTLTVTTAFTAANDTTTQYRVGGIVYSCKTGRMDVADTDVDHARGVEVYFEPTTGQNYFDIRRYYNHESTAVTNPVTDTTARGGLVATTAGNADAVVDMKVARSTASNHPGWCRFVFSGRTGSRSQGVRWVQLEVRGTKGDDEIKFYDLNLGGLKWRILVHISSNP